MICEFKEWVNTYAKDRIFRMWILKRGFTPYEQELKAIDETFYENPEAMFIMIREAVVLPDGDILLGIESIDGYTKKELETEKKYIEYYKLSEIELAYSEKDEDIWDEEK